MNKVSKIEIDRIKQGCNCKYFEGRTRNYIVKECKACLHKKGIYTIGNEYKERIEYLLKLKEQLKINEIVLKDLSLIKPVENSIKKNWIQKLMNI